MVIGVSIHPNLVMLTSTYGMHSMCCTNHKVIFTMENLVFPNTYVHKFDCVNMHDKAFIPIFRSIGTKENSEFLFFVGSGW